MSVELKQGRALGILNLTSLIDVVFLLLVFFLVTTRFAEEERERDVDLPSATEAQPLTVEPQQILVNIDRQGRYLVDGRTLTLAEVGDVLERAATDNPTNQSVVIRADRRVPLEPVVEILNLCNRAGIYEHSLATSDDD